MKRIIAIWLLIAAIFLCALYLLRENWMPGPGNAQGGIKRYQQQGNNTQQVDQPKSKKYSARNDKLIFSLRRTDYMPDRDAQALAQKDVPYECRGGGGEGRVTDRVGGVILESTKEFGIFGASVSPAGTWIFAHGGSAKNLVFTPGKEEKQWLPTAPPGKNMLGFGSWHWINDHMLVGEAGTEKLGVDGLPVKTEDNVAESKLYIYDINTRELAEVALPAELKGQVFGVIESSGDGHLFIGIESPRDDDKFKEGWFKIGE
jgi:hypothetical protein